MVRHRIGLIADVQYADIDDVWNFMKTAKRKYRGTLTALHNAVNWWVQQERIDLIADLGDAIDGFRNETRQTGMSAIRTVMSEWNRLQVAKPMLPIMHLIGNHELYKFTRTELTTEVEDTGFSCASPHNIVPDKRNCIYYTFKLSDTSPWRAVVLDPYEQSVMTNGGGRIGHELTLENGGIHKDFTNLCQSHNPNDILHAANFFAGISGVESRWCPFNGGVSDEQLMWLEQVLADSVKKSEKVMLFTHVILHPEATPKGNCHTLLWNYDAVLALLGTHKCVRMVFAGHAHSEGYHYCESSGVHHISLASPLEAPEDLVKSTFATLEIADNDMSAELVGRGWVSTRSLVFY